MPWGASVPQQGIGGIPSPDLSGQDPGNPPTPGRDTHEPPTDSLEVDEGSMPPFRLQTRRPPCRTRCRPGGCRGAPRRSTPRSWGRPRTPPQPPLPTNLGTSSVSTPGGPGHFAPGRGVAECAEGLLRLRWRLHLKRLLQLSTEFGGHTVFGANASAAPTPSSAYLMTSGGAAPA